MWRELKKDWKETSKIGDEGFFRLEWDHHGRLNRTGIVWQLDMKTASSMMKKISQDLATRHKKFLHWCHTLS